MDWMCSVTVPQSHIWKKNVEHCEGQVKLSLDNKMTKMLIFKGPENTLFNQLLKMSDGVLH